MPTIEAINTSIANIAEAYRQHPLKRIFGLDVEPTSKPVVYSAFTGCGKTTGISTWLAKIDKDKELPNYKILPRKLVLAFKELQLAAEFIVSFNNLVKERSETERSNLKRHISYVFGVDQEQIDKIAAQLSDDKGNKILKGVLTFLGTTTATTSLCKEKITELNDAKVIVTTHASANNLACAGIIRKTDVIYDEEPADCYQIHELTVGETKEEHVAKLLSCSTTIDLIFSGPKRIGKFLSCGVWTTSQVYTLSPNEVKELSKNPVRSHPKGDSVARFCCVDTEQVNDSEVTHYTPKPTIVRQQSSGDYQAKQGDLTHFFVSYVDFDSFGANSISILTACPEGTSVAVLEKLSGTKFQTVEGEVSKARRSLVASKTTLCQIFEEFGSISCAKANSISKRAKFAVAGMAEALSHYSNVFVVSHGWLANAFHKFGLRTCKSNQKGLNAFRDCTAVGVASLDFQRPKDKIIEQHIFKEDYAKRERFVLASGVGQAIMRSALRLKEPLETAIVYYDKRVEEFWDLFVGG